MTRNRKALGILFVAVLGIWGCTRTPMTDNANSNADKIKALEAKTAKLESDLKGVLAGRESLRRQLETAEENQAQLQRQIDQLQPVVKERDDLLGLVKAKTLENEQLQGQYDGFRRQIRQMLNQAEAALPAKTPAGLVSRPGTKPTTSDGGGS